MYSKRGVTFESCFEDLTNIINFHVYYWDSFFLDSNISFKKFSDLYHNILFDFVSEYDNLGVYTDQYTLYYKNVYERQKRIEEILSVVRLILSTCVETLPIRKRIPSCPMFADPDLFSQAMIRLEKDLLSKRGNSVFPPYVPLNNSNMCFCVIDIYYKRLELDEVVHMCDEMESLCRAEDIDIGCSNFLFCRTYFEFDN